LTQKPPQSTPKPKGFLNFTLHAHLPYVVNHGTWPHGMEWLLEAAAETYLPMLRMLSKLERDNIRFHANLNLSPILLEQLSHPSFIAEFPRYVTRKIVAAREDEAFFIQAGDDHLAETARFWHHFFTQALEDFQSFNGDIIGAFRHFNDIGLIEIITSGATHAYLPLLGTDESVRAQIRTAVETHIRHIGKAPRGIWSPECGYRPAGFWNYPVPFADGQPTPSGFERIGVEQALAESNIEFFVVDTHLVEDSQAAWPYESRTREPRQAPPEQKATPGGTIQASADLAREQVVEPGARSLYQAYYVDGPYRDENLSATTIFARDPRTGIQVWSGDTGYPGDAAYLDFHKKRWPGGHRYWRVTGAKVDIGEKEPYHHHHAPERVKEHAAHYVQLVRQALDTGFNDDISPILCSPFDAELFGHWWFEGVQWLEAVARELHERDYGVQLITCGEYLDLHPRAGFIAMPEGSWGVEGNHQVWLNSDTSWTYTHIYPAELYVRDVCTAALQSGALNDSPHSKRILQQLCRELLLLESSDWQFLITTGAARDYAEIRFLTHNDQFNEVKAFYQAFEANGALTQEQETRLAEIEQRDSIFPYIDPALWAAHAKQQPTETPVEVAI
jgi:1,4-alpha-glucan branching enzyme